MWSRTVPRPLTPRFRTTLAFTTTRCWYFHFGCAPVPPRPPPRSLREDVPARRPPRLATSTATARRKLLPPPSVEPFLAPTWGRNARSPAGCRPGRPAVAVCAACSTQGVLFINGCLISAHILGCYASLSVIETALTIFCIPYYYRKTSS